MVRNKGNRKAMLNQFDKLESIYIKRTFVPAVVISVNEDGTITIDPTGKQGVFETLQEAEKYIRENQTISEKTKFFVDDFFTVPDNLYLPSELLWTDINAAIRREFIEMAKSDPAKWLQAYIDLLKDIFEINEIDYNPPIISHSIRCGDHWLTDDELREQNIQRQIEFRQTAISVGKEIMQHYPAVVDLLEQFDKMTVPDLLERYKDQKWFNKSEITVPDCLEWFRNQKWRDNAN